MKEVTVTVTKTEEQKLTPKLAFLELHCGGTGRAEFCDSTLDAPQPRDFIQSASLALTSETVEYILTHPDVIKKIQDQSEGMDGVPLFQSDEVKAAIAAASEVAP